MDHRQPRLNGDTRRRKRRLREKLAKRDAIRYAPAIRAVAAELKRRVMDKIEREIFANSVICVKQEEK
jgi:ribosomal protein L25 (general stress protein Ctc)